MRNEAIRARSNCEQRWRRKRRASCPSRESTITAGQAQGGRALRRDGHRGAAEEHREAPAGLLDLRVRIAGFLFEDTLAANVRYGRLDATDQDILASAEELGLGDWVAGLPRGLDTRVGQRGESLSAGERQLVALLRAHLADPDLLVLDEATSAVDPALEMRIGRALERLMSGRTLSPSRTACPPRRAPTRSWSSTAAGSCSAGPARSWSVWRVCTPGCTPRGWHNRAPDPGPSS